MEKLSALSVIALKIAALSLREPMRLLDNSFGWLYCFSSVTWLDVIQTTFPEQSGLRNPPQELALLCAGFFMEWQGL